MGKKQISPLWPPPGKKIWENPLLPRPWKKSFRRPCIIDFAVEGMKSDGLSIAIFRTGCAYASTLLPPIFRQTFNKICGTPRNQFMWPAMR